MAMEPPPWPRRRVDAFSAALLRSELAAETSLQDATPRRHVWTDPAMNRSSIFQWIVQFVYIFVCCFFLYCFGLMIQYLFKDMCGFLCGFDGGF